MLNIELKPWRAVLDESGLDYFGILGRHLGYCNSSLLTPVLVLDARLWRSDVKASRYASCTLGPGNMFVVLFDGSLVD